jgi:hypothetical protein
MKRLVFSFSVLLIAIVAQAQTDGVLIDYAAGTRDNTAVFQLNATAQGFLVPRIDLDNATTPISAAKPEALLVYNDGGSIGPDGFYYWNGTTWVMLLSQNGNNSNSWLTSGNSGITQPSVPVTYGTSTFLAGENYIGTTDAKDLVFGTANKERLRILSSNGSVGIGTTAPGSKLDVRSDALGITQDDTKGISVSNTTIAAAAAQQISPPVRWLGNGWATTPVASQSVEFIADVLPVQGTTAPSATWRIGSSINGGAYSYQMVVTSAGNLGVGITTPSARLELLQNAAGTSNMLRLRNNQAAALNNGAGMQFRINRTTGGATDIAGITGIITDIGDATYKGALGFSTSNAAAPAERMRIDHQGYVGIGTTTPASMLSVGATSQFQVNSSGAIAAATGITSSGTITFSGLTPAGIVTNTAGGVLGTTATVPVGNLPNLAGDVSGAVNATVVADDSHNHTELEAKPQYSWNAATLPRDFPQAIATSFVRAADGWPEYGSVVHVGTYPDDGGSLQLYAPYNATYGGNSLRYRLGLYNNAGWTGWKTLWDDTNDGAGSGMDADLLDGQHGSYYAPSTGSGNYIQNQTGSAQAGAGFYTAGTGNALAFGVSNTSPTTGNGVSLYGGPASGQPSYGLMFAGTATFGTHGSIGGADWATYLTMNNSTTRGWIFRRGSTNVASVDGNGTMSLSGRLRLADNTQTEFYSSGNRLMARSENVDGVAEFASYGMYLPKTGQTYNLYLGGSLKVGHGESGNIDINDANTRINEGSGNAIRLQTNYGYIDVGAQNTSWAHIQSDRASFYFNPKITVDGNAEPYTDNTRTLGTPSLRWNNGYFTNLTLGGVTISSWPSGADNLGNHIATTTITTNGNDIDFVRGDLGEIHSIGRISFDWTAGTYDDANYHGIESENEAGSFSDNLRINSYNDIINTIDANSNDATSYFKVQEHSAGDGTDLFWVRSPDGYAYHSGSVGIGTTSPVTNLQVTGSATSAVTVSSSNYPTTYKTQLGAQAGAQGILVLGNNATNEIRFGNTGAGGFGNIYVNNTADYSSAATGTLAATFAANGKVGIGTSAPTENLSVAGALTTANFQVKRDFVTWNTTASTNVPIHIKTNITFVCIMYRFLVEGYNYGMQRAIYSEAVGYADCNPSPTAVTSAQNNNHSNGVSISTYKSNDGYLVIKLDPGGSNYYLGFSVSAWLTNPAGNGFDVKATTIVQSSAADPWCTFTPGSASFAYSGSIVNWTVPACVTSITITAKGASGGYYPGYTPGYGASMTGTFAVTPGQVLSILVGQSPGSCSCFPGGGGGTFVALGGTYSSATPMIVAGGGGGAYSGYSGVGAPTTNDGTGSWPGTGGNGAPAVACGGGGGGFYSNGGNDTYYGYPGGKGFWQGGAGASVGGGYQNGGFGGGAVADYVGSCNTVAGAGGGYGGGSAYNNGSYNGSGQAGGSYNGGTSQSNTPNNNNGNGSVTITW